ncbi:MAG TPA: MGMT family protein, partial [Oleiagrimonas sp.]|nr:MGMT family protein [Oleiagrimonas sp.]
HRVIGSNGSLTGYGGGLAAKQWLLAHERKHAPVEALELTALI